MKTKEDLIDFLIDCLIEASWKSKLGRKLIQAGEIRLTPERVEELRQKLFEILTFIEDKDRIIIPIGTLRDDDGVDFFMNETLHFYFFLIYEGKFRIMISQHLNPSMIKKGNLMDEKRTENILVSFLSYTQKNPEIVSDELKVINSTLKEG